MRLFGAPPPPPPPPPAAAAHKKNNQLDKLNNNAPAELLAAVVGEHERAHVARHAVVAAAVHDLDAVGNSFVVEAVDHAPHPQHLAFFLIVDSC